MELEVKDSHTQRIFELFVACHTCSSKYIVAQIRSIHRFFKGLNEFHLYLWCRGDSVEYIHAQVCHHFFLREISESLMLSPSPTCIFHRCLFIFPRLELFNSHRFGFVFLVHDLGKKILDHSAGWESRLILCKNKKSRFGTVTFDAIFYKRS